MHAWKSGANVIGKSGKKIENKYLEYFEGTDIAMQSHLEATFAKLSELQLNCKNTHFMRA